MWQQENELVAVGLESIVVGQHLDSMAVSQKALDEEIEKYNKLLTSNQAKISSFVTLIDQKQATITKYNKKIHQIAASTGVRESWEAGISDCLLFVWNMNLLETIAYKNYMIPWCFVCLHPQHEDMSPQQIKVQALKTQNAEQAANIKRDQQLWMTRQETLVGMTKETEANSKNMLKLQMEFTEMQQKKIRLESM